MNFLEERIQKDGIVKGNRDCLYCGQVFRRTGSVCQKGKEREPGRGDVHSGSGVLYP